MNTAYTEFYEDGFFNRHWKNIFIQRLNEAPAEIYRTASQAGGYKVISS